MIHLSKYKYKVISKILNFIIEILSKLINIDSQIEYFVLDNEREIDKSQELLKVMNSNKKIDNNHSVAYVP